MISLLAGSSQPDPAAEQAAGGHPGEAGQPGGGEEDGGPILVHASFGQPGGEKGGEQEQGGRTTSTPAIQRAAVQGGRLVVRMWRGSSSSMITSEFKRLRRVSRFRWRCW